MIRQWAQVQQITPELSMGSVMLCYDQSDPFAVKFVFVEDDGEEVPWEFARDLLRDGLRGECAGRGDVRFWRQGSRLMLNISSDDGAALLSLAADDVRSFLRRTYRVVPRSREAVDVDAALAELLDGAM